MTECEKRLETKNGVEVFTYKNPALHSFQISLFVKAGCMYEKPDESGITHFLEHVAIRNVNRLYDMKLYRMLDANGLSFNAMTYSEMVHFFTAGASENFSVAAPVIAALLDPITLTREEIDAERRRIKAEIRESDDKSSLASFANKIVFEGTSLAGTIVGTNKSVDKITRKRLEDYRKSTFTKENVFFYITGNFTDEDIADLVSEIEKRELLGAERRKNVAPVPTSFGKRPSDIFIKSDDYVAVRFIFDLDAERIPMPVADLLYDMLLSGYNSKLFIEMSENRGLFYDTSESLESFANIGTLNFSYEVRPTDLCSAIDLTVDILNSMKSPTDAEVNAAKASYVDNALMLYDDVRELNFTFAYENHVTGAGYRSIEERRDAYSAVTAEQIGSAARELFTEGNLTLTIKGNKKTINKEAIKKSIRRLV